MTREEAARLIAERINAEGGRAYYVGGYVRDCILGINNDDLDIEVHNLPEEKLLPILQSVGEISEAGLEYGIFLLTEYGIDVALPKTEKCTGKGHRDFEVTVNPYLDMETSSRRRDFTVNSMLMDVLSGEITDPFGGREDLKNRIIRHIDDNSFAEDPLRVLRGFRFASRFGCTIDEKTLELCRKMDITALPPERIEEELRKLFSTSDKPSVFFEYLRITGKLDYWFKELVPLIGLEQNPVYHPEGDAWVHTMDALDRAAAVRHRSKDPFKFMLLALTHDLGKAVTTEFSKGAIHSYNHENAGIAIALDFVGRITNNKDVKSYIENMLPLHMKPNIKSESHSAIKSTNKMFDDACEPYDLVLFSFVDRDPSQWTGENESFLSERYEIYKEYMSRPYVMGKDLIEAGIKPGIEFRKLLDFAHKLRLAGINKNEALRQTLAMAGVKQKKQ